MLHLKTERLTFKQIFKMSTELKNKDLNSNDAKLPVMRRASKIKKAKDIVGRIFILYDEKDKTGHWELNKATDAIYAYIKELEQS